MALPGWIQLLWFDGDGLCLFTKRLERGRFVWPKADGGTVALSRAQLSMLLEGIDWRRPERTFAPPLAVLPQHNNRLYSCGFSRALSTAFHGILKA